MAKVYSLQEILNYAKEKSPFYGDLYKNLDIRHACLEEVPILEQSQFWQANSLTNNSLLTGPISDGIVFKSGGTTGHPKFSIFTKEEWETFTELFGRSLDHIGMTPGDRIGNLFYSGGLYASFVFIMKSLEYARTPVVHFPITGQSAIDEIIKIIKEFKINVLFGVPTSFMNMAHKVEQRQERLPIEKIFYGGEKLFAEQQECLKKIFPGVQISSVGYASVDGGHLGYVCEPKEEQEHCVFLESSIMEIIDEDTGEVINQKGKVGKLVYTNLTRRLMPIIRYPVGDLAVWTEIDKVNGMERGTRFVLLGRSEEGARIGPVTINRDDISHILSHYEHRKIIANFQMLLRRNENKDELTLRIVPSNTKMMSKQVLTENLDDFVKVFYQQRKMFKEAVDQSLICPLNIEIVSSDQLITNSRTGKLKIVVDQR